MAEHGAEGWSAPFSKFWTTYIAGFDPMFGLDPDQEHGFLAWIGEFGISRALIMWLFFIAMMWTLSIQIPNLFTYSFAWLAGTAPVWLPIGLYIAAWKSWLNYVKSTYVSPLRLKPVVLEVKVPRVITKSPRAMEMVFTNLFASSGEVSFIHRAWGGGTRPFYSFEIASFGGEIHFYVWCWNSYRRLIETSIYAQYPEVEIVEVEDYMSKFQFDPHKHIARVGDYVLKGAGDEYPLKTYVDFELDKDPDEEFLVDPLATAFEVLSNLKPTEQCWIQMLFRYETTNGVIIRKKSTWAKRVEKEVDVIRAAMIFKDPALSKEEQGKGFPRPTWKQTELMRAMERQLTKTPLEVGMRFAYISEGELHGPTFTAIRWIYKLYNWPNFAQFMRSFRGHDPFDYPWQDYDGIRWTLVTRRWLDAMRRRSYFTPPYISPTFVSTAEMLASFYHYPSSAIKTPGLQRIQATKSEPPPNLPR
jgi:hypothetical protein